ncbi:zinc finger HIT domain-containing protein 3-like, partial [Trifolium medium]|nr:zinc finger HIT domain-containing protein 3-like [Trifolium medium]
MMPFNKKLYFTRIRLIKFHDGKLRSFLCCEACAFHKAVLESVVEKPPAVNNTVLEALVDRPLAVDKNAEVLQQSQLEAIASSSEIRYALNDKTLQELICHIDCSPNAENELHKAMAEEAFHLFTDKVMLSAESHMDSLPL